MRNGMNGATDFDIEMKKFNQDLAELRPQALANPGSADAVTKFVYRLYQCAALNGNLRLLEEVESELDAAIERLGPAPDLLLLKANLDFKLHRLAATKRDLERGTGLLDTPQGKALLADVILQEGHYQEARGLYESLIQQDRTWDNLARLAHLEARMGDLSGAERLYIEAEDEITSKEMRSFAWVEVQRGLLHFKHGRLKEALEHYERADQAYSGYYLVEEHVAEVLAAEHKFSEAASMYEKVIERVPKPELQQALGALYDMMGRSQDAEDCYQAALAVYLRSAERGDVHYYHHLVDFYCDAHKDAAEALKWALKDLETRNNSSTQAAAAWAFHLNGRHDEAIKMIDQALSSAAREPGLFLKAGKIYNAARGDGSGDSFLALAAKLNPHSHSFHVHH